MQKVRQANLQFCACTHYCLAHLRSSRSSQHGSARNCKTQTAIRCRDSLPEAHMRPDTLTHTHKAAEGPSRPHVLKTCERSRIQAADHFVRQTVQATRSLRNFTMIPKPACAVIFQCGHTNGLHCPAGPGRHVTPQPLRISASGAAVQARMLELWVTTQSASVAGKRGGGYGHP